MPVDAEGGWLPLLPPGFAGPQNLAALVLDFRRWRARSQDALDSEAAGSPISDRGLARLLDLAYQASLEKDEGRDTRLRLFVCSENPSLQPRLLVRFAEPVRLQDSGPIRRLAPAVGPHDYALCVCETAGELRAEGVVALDDPGEDVPIGELGLASVMARPGLAVRVVGPGQLRVSEMMLGTYELCAGRIRAIEPFNLAIPVDNWLRQHAAAVLAWTGLARRANAGVIQYAAYVLARDLWSRVLMTAADLRHGGTFVIAPDGELADFVTIKFPATDLSLGLSAADFFKACVRIQEEARGACPPEDAEDWLRRKRDLQADARALGHLSAVDGCVVVDPELSLRGFGGHINVDEGQARRAGRVFADFRTRRPRPESDLHRFGTRHGSAYRLCQAVAGCLVFVISQDGHLRVFASDAEHVFLFDALSAEARHRDKC
jgi:hypothetical protein